MNRQEKAAFVGSFHDALKASPLVVAAGFKGTTVNQANSLRRQLEKKGVRLRVVKNTLAKRALAGTGMEELAPHLVGMTALFLSNEDPIASAKVLREIATGLPTLQFIAGFYEGEVFVGESVKGIADLPSKNDLLATLLRTMQEPPVQLLSLLEAPARDLLSLLKNYENKLSEAGAE